MPSGKPAGVRCVQLDADLRCRLFGLPERPAVCASLSPTPEMCGTSAPQAMRWLGRLERLTAPLQAGSPGQASGLPLQPRPMMTSNDRAPND